MPDPERLPDSDGNVYERNILGDYVPARSGGFWPERDVGLLGPNIERDASGGPKKARTWTGAPRTARNGRQLYVPSVPLGSPGESLEGFLLWIVWAAIVVMVVIACIGLWILWRFLQSLYYDIQDRHLSGPTVVWGIPVGVVVVAAMVSALTPHGYGTPVSANTGPGRTPTATHSRSYREQQLKAAAPGSIRSLCDPFRSHVAGNDPFAAGAVAATSCDGIGGGVQEYAAFQFLDGRKLAGYYLDRIDGAGVSPDSGSCPSDHVETAWAYGRVACWVSRTGSKLAHVRWTDERTDVYGVLDASGRDLRSLYRWWLANVANG